MIKPKCYKHTVPLDDGKWLRVIIATESMKTQMQPSDETVARIRAQVFDQIAQDSIYLVA